MIDPTASTPGPDMAGAAASRQERERETVQRASRKATAALRQPNADTSAAPIGPQASPPPREDLESIEFDLPNGMHVVFGPPPGISLSYRIVTMMGGADTGIAHQRLLRALLCVRSIDGAPVTITSEIDANSLANRLGDGSIELLHYFLSEHWPPIRRAELPALKKNLRG